ncbi:MAG: DUF3795 domain-containing protein [Eubacteriales bacterium]
MSAELIAPCGMNCRLCMRFQRDKKQCEGCNGDNTFKTSSCLNCIIKNCSIIQNSLSGMCYECHKFPCRRLKQLDRRYRDKYHMSMIDNLEIIKTFGMDVFLQKEIKRWRCSKCQSIVCVHRDVCLTCRTPYIK